MPIPMVMLSDEIKASDDYAKYLAKSLGTKPANTQGKGLLTMKEVADAVDSKETKEEEEPMIRRRPIGVVICGEAHRESDEEEVDHSMKLKGIEMLSAAAQFKLDLKKARKDSKDDFILQQRPKSSGEGSGVTPEVPDGLSLKGPNEGSGVTPAVLDEPSNSSSSSCSVSDDEIKDISSDEVDDTKKAKESNKFDVAQDVEEQVEEEQAEEELHFDDQRGNEQVCDVQAKFHVTESLIKKLQATILILQQKSADQRPLLVDITVTLIPESTLSPKQPPQTQLKRSKTKQILEKSKQPETQVDTSALDNRLTRLEKKVDAMSRFNLPEEIDKSV
ncbi:hypothetical protein Tco_0993750 [Tanacetum coccineum]